MSSKVRQGAVPTKDHKELQLLSGGARPKGAPSNSRKALSRWLFLLVCLLLVAGFAAYNRASSIPQVEIGTAQVRDITGSFTAEAYVRGKSFDVASELPGRITKLLVSEGQAVTRGQVIAELDGTEAEQTVVKARAARETAATLVAQARSEWQLAKRQSDAGIGAAKARVRQAEAGVTRAKAGALPEELSQAQHRVDAAQAALDEAGKAYTRAQILYAEGAAPRAAFDAAESRLQAAKAELGSAQDVLQALRNGPRAEDIAIAQTTLDSAKADLNSAIEASGVVAVRLGAVQTAQKALDQAQSDLVRSKILRDKLMVRSPATGILSQRSVELGMVVAAGLPIAKISTREDLRIEAEVDTEDIAKVSSGMPVVISSAAYPSRTFAGKVEAIMPMGELKPGSAIQTRIVRVRIRLDGNWNLFRPEMELDIEGKAHLKRTLVVPSDAVTFGKDKVTLWKVKDGKVLEVPIKVGYTTATETEILDGLSDGESVVVAGKDNLVDGQRVKVGRTDAR